MSTSPDGIGLAPVPVCLVRCFAELLRKQRSDERAILRGGATLVLLKGRPTVTLCPAKRAQLCRS